MPYICGSTSSISVKLVDTIILSLAVAFFVIGVHQVFYVGIAASYWLFMLSGGLVLWFKLRKDKAGAPEATNPQPVSQTKPAKKAKTTPKR